MARVAGIFGYLADRDFHGYSPLYEHLARRMAADDQLLALVTASRHNTAPILFFACVHDVVLRQPEGELARAYRAVADGGDPAALGVWELFRGLVLTRADELSHLMATRVVQTNEVGRSAALAAALALLADHGHRRLALVEIGASAGLNLLLDRYRITYAADDHHRQQIGPPDSPVQLACVLHGTRRPPSPAGPAPAITSRLGLDRMPVDVTDPDAVRWLQACLWPDLIERRQRLDAAVALAAADPPELWAGDALDLVDPAVAAADPGDLVVVISTWVLAYFTPSQRRQLHQVLDRLGRSRPLVWITAEYEANVAWLGPVGAPPPSIPASSPPDWGSSGGTARTTAPSRWPGCTPTASGWSGWSTRPGPDGSGGARLHPPKVVGCFLVSGAIRFGSIAQLAGRDDRYRIDPPSIEHGCNLLNEEMVPPMTERTEPGRSTDRAEPPTPTDPPSVPPMGTYSPRWLSGPSHFEGLVATFSPEPDHTDGADSAHESH